MLKCEMLKKYTNIFLRYFVGFVQFEHFVIYNRTETSFGKIGKLFNSNEIEFNPIWKILCFIY